MVARVVTAPEAAALVKDGATITVSGIFGTMLPEQVLVAIEARFLNQGHPRDLFWYDPTPTGAGPGFYHLVHEGLLKRVVQSHLLPLPELVALVKANKVEAYCYPLATGHFLLREIGAGRSGYLTKVGLHTFMDPRQSGGRLNPRTTKELIEVREFGGEEWLWYQGFPIDVAIIRGTTADEVGNIGFEEEPLSLGGLNQAQAAKTSGGIVIAQVKRRARKGAIHPRHALVPGWLVDYIVVDPNQPQSVTYPDRYVEGATGSPRVPDPPIVFHPLSADKLAGRRAALELRPGDVINVGAGIGISSMGPASREEGLEPLYTLTIEHGNIHGLYGGSAGPMVINPTYMPDYTALFHHYYGGNLDACFLALGQVDKEGNNNLHRIGDIIVGPGGAMDIAQGTPRVIFSGTFTADGLEIEANDGQLRILREGKQPRFVDRVDEITFNGRDFWGMGKKVLFVTERAVFQLAETGIELIEIAPGIDLERDVLGHMGFRPHISARLKKMEARIFSEPPMGLHRDWTGQPFVPSVDMVIEPTYSFGSQWEMQRQQR